MVNLRSKEREKQCKHTPTKRSRQVEVIHIESDPSDSEARAISQPCFLLSSIDQKPKVFMDFEGYTEEERAKEEEEDSQTDLRLLGRRRSSSFPRSRRFTVLSSEEEDNVPFRNHVTVLSSEAEDNVPICKQVHKVISMNVLTTRHAQSCNPSLKVYSDKVYNRALIGEPSGRRRLFKLSPSALPMKQHSDALKESIDAQLACNKSKEDNIAHSHVRRRLISSPSTSSQEAGSTIETDSDNKPIAQRLLLYKLEEFSTATSSPSTTNIQNYATRARRRASQDGNDDVQTESSKLSMCTSSLPMQRKEASPPLPTPAPNMCREIVPLGIDQPLSDNMQRKMVSRNIEAAKRVKDMLRLFNSYYLRFVQEEETRCRKEATEKVKKKERSRSEERRLSRRPDLKAITQMRMDKKMDHVGKTLGSVPGVNVGDQFFSRCEMVAIGLHCHWLGGIDTIPASCKKELGISRLPVASSIVLSGNYEDDIDNSDDVIYTGSGGNDLLGNKRQIADQVLKRGNLALKNNMEQEIPVRLVRGHKTKKSYTGKVYTYDGLYKVKDYWAERGISGFTVYKFRLKRVEGQPILTTNQVHFVSGHVVPTNITELKGLVCADISNGLESTPIPATNLQNPPFAPNDFKYTVKIEVRKGVRKPIPAQGCDCEGECFDPYKCSCAIRNNNRFPYVTQNGGRLVEPMDVVYECGPNCGCSQRCSNRVTQKGMQYRLEVFRTANKGWGMRSWDTIPAGAPVCQYTGVLMRTEDADDICDNEYIFELDCLQTIKGIGGRQRRSISNGNKIGLDEGAFMNVPEQPEYCIDAGNSGSVSRLINHSCEPNLFVQCVLNDHHDLSQPRIWFFAAETIHPLQELSYDYGYALDSVVKNGKVKVLPCYCGALECRKRLH